MDSERTCERSKALVKFQEEQAEDMEKIE